MARAAGSPSSQIIHFARGRYLPQRKQLAFHVACRACDEVHGPTQVGFGGARGPGKSHALLAQIALDDCQRVAGLKCLLLRKVGKSVREQFEDLRLKVLRYVPHEYRRSDGVLTFANGSRIILGHFHDEGDVDAYLGLEYDVIGVEEATTLSLRKYKAILTCNRSGGGKFRPRVYSTTNPGGVGHAWYRQVFVKPWQASQARSAGRGSQEQETRFIPATIDDNRFINPEYRSTLDGLSGWLKRAWRHGDWDIAAGQFFTTWRADIHVIRTGGTEEGSGGSGPLQTPFVPHLRAGMIPANWTVWLAMDYGFAHYNVVLLLAQDGDGVIYALDEHAERGWLVPRHAAAVRSMLGRWGIAPERVWGFAAGRDCWAARPTGLGTIADQWDEEGFSLEEADDDRIQGAAEVLRRLGDVEGQAPSEGREGSSEPVQTEEEKAGEAVKPTLFVLSQCARLIECLPTLEHDPHRPEDVLKVDCDEEGGGGDDAYDALRYGLMAAPRESVWVAHDELSRFLADWRG